MKAWFIWAGIGLCLFSIWAIARNDWKRLTRPSRRVMAQVSAHRESWENASRTFAPIYRFLAEDGEHEVVDMLHSSSPQPAVGTARELHYPAGHPELARPSRPLLWIAIYGFLLTIPGLLFSLWMGWID